MTPPKKIFISYAHSDGTALALRLHDDLSAQGYFVWLDIKKLTPGSNWSSAIEAAISDTDVTLALLSEGSFASEICRAEQIMSSDKKKVIIPLLVQPDAPRPIHLYVRQYVNFGADSLYDASLQSLLDNITNDMPAAPRMTRRNFNNAPRLPQNFIAREDELNRLRDLLMSDETDRKLALTALRGMGGIGKSVLAAAICHDPLAQAAFPDGMVWVTIGRTPGSLVESMRIVGEALGDAGGAYTSEATAMSRLRELLREKSALIVLDDAWDAVQVEPFLAEAPRCRFLITTREGKVASRLGAHELRIHQMKPDEALQLLREWAEHDDSNLATIAKRVGYLPLALKLAGARLREGMGGAEWLASFEHLSDIKLDYDSDSPNENVAACLELSVSRLKPDEQPLYHALGIFKDDTRIPDATITRLWRQIKPAWSDHQCGEFLQHLDRLALLERDPSTKLTTMHDLLNDYTQERLKAAETYQAIHNVLLAGYNLPPGKRWHEVADAYLLPYLIYHLIEAGRTNELPTLFADDEWMRARWEADGYVYTGFIEDLMTAWEIASEKAVEDDLALALCLHYTLIRTTINSLAGNYVPELVARAVELELPGWSLKRGLSIARNIPDAEQKANLYTVLLKTGKGNADERHEAQKRGLAAALALPQHDILGNSPRANVLAALAGQLSGEAKEQTLEHGLALALPEQDKFGDSPRASVLAALAGQLSGGLLEQGLAAALALPEQGQFGDSPRVTALAALAGRLSGGLLEQGLAAALLLEEKYNRAAVLAALAGQLSGEAKEQALEQGLAAALALENEDLRASALAALAGQLSGKLLEQGLAAALALKYENKRASVLAALAGRLSGELLEQGLAAALALKYENKRASVLAALAGRLSGQLLEQGLAAALALENEDNRASALAALAGQLSGGLLEQGLAAALLLEEKYNRAEVLAAMAGQLSGEAKEQALEQGLAAALALPEQGQFGGSPRASALAAMAGQLSGQLLEQGLAAALALEYEDLRASALAALAGQLSGKLLEQGLAAALALENEDNRASALAALAGQLSGEAKEQALEQGLAAALALPEQVQFGGSPRASALAALAGQLSGEAKEQALEQGLAAALAIRNERNRASVLAALAGQLSGKLLEQGLAAALAFEDEGNRASALAALAGQLSGKLLEQGLAAALALPEQVQFGGSPRARVLAALAGQLSGELLEQGLAAALALPEQGQFGDSPRASALAALAGQLSGEAKEQALEQGLAAALALEDEDNRASALAALAGQLSGGLLEQGLAAVLLLEEKYNRAKVLTAMAGQLSGEAKEQALEQGLAAALALEYEDLRARALAVLAGQLSTEQNRQNINRRLRGMQSEKREAVLGFCAQKNLFAPPIFSPQALGRIAQSIMDICGKWRWG